ncbi:MAG: hypothetical protein BZ137_01110 [Methanosphaera sp. rholeuAM130]|nr:MAG: hypothetical protein BZ137_01110 [Methanosphaera sp. rholeuAM130]
MKGYETAFDICKIVNKDDKIRENELLIYPGGWKNDFFSIFIKNFEEYDENVKYACDKIKEVIDQCDEWTFIKDSYDDRVNQVEVHAKRME